MRFIAAIAIFLTAFAITANMHIYVQSLRLFIYAWHIFVPVIPIHLALALFMGTLLQADRATSLYYLWAILFLLVIGISLMSATGSAASISEATRYATTFGIGLSFLAVAQHRTLAIAGALGIGFATLVAAGISFAEFLNPDFTAIVDQRYERDQIKEGVISRVGGLHINPNSNARFMTFGMFVSCFFLPKKFRLLFCLFVGAAVFTTVSRSGMLTWALAMIMLTYLGQLGSGKAHTKLIGVVGISVLGLLLTTGQIPKLINYTGMDEYMSESMIDRLSSGFFDQGDESTGARKELVGLGVEMYSDNPIIGAGPGQSRALGDTGLGSHNMLIQIAAELGTVGLLVYFGLFLVPLSLRSSKAMSFFVLLTVSGMFAHDLLGKAVIAFILPAGIVLLSKLDLQQHQSRTHNSRSNKKRRRRSSRPAVARA